MDQDNNLPFDIEEVIDVVRRLDVIVVGFPLFPERLLIDARHREGVAPLLRVVPPVASRAERMRDLVRLRPEFGLPNQHVFFVWPRSITSFRRSGIWDEIVDRVVQADAGASFQADAALEELRRLERRSLQEAISGESYQTLWERAS